MTPMAADAENLLLYNNRSRAAIRPGVRLSTKYPWDASKGRSPSILNPQDRLCRSEERSYRFLYQFSAVK